LLQPVAPSEGTRQNLLPISKSAFGKARGGFAASHFFCFFRKDDCGCIPRKRQRHAPTTFSWAPFHQLDKEDTIGANTKHALRCSKVLLDECLTHETRLSMNIYAVMEMKVL